MKNYKGYYIDHVVFNSTADIDSFIEKQAVDAYKTACELFAANPSMELSIYADSKAEILVNQFGYTLDQIEAIEIEAYKAA